MMLEFAERVPGENAPPPMYLWESFLNDLPLYWEDLVNWVVGSRNVIISPLISAMLLLVNFCLIITFSRLNLPQGFIGGRLQRGRQSLIVWRFRILKFEIAQVGPRDMLNNFYFMSMLKSHSFQLKRSMIFFWTSSSSPWCTDILGRSLQPPLRHGSHQMGDPSVATMLW